MFLKTGPCTGVCLEQRPAPEVLPCSPQEQWIMSCSSLCGVQRWELQLILLRAGLWWVHGHGESSAWAGPSCRQGIICNSRPRVSLMSPPQFQKFLVVMQNLPVIAMGFPPGCPTAPKPAVPPHCPAPPWLPEHLELPEDLHINLSLCQPLCP